jgi:hypothetical protein
MMLGLAVYAAVLAYGRVSKTFAPIHWVALAVIALVTTAITAQMMGIGDERVLLGMLLQFLLLGLLYTAGVFAGRWLDRDKDREYD